MPYPTFALLPLYLAVYDRALPELLGRQEKFLAQVHSWLQQQNIELLVLPTCRTRAQAMTALAQVEKSGIAGIITLHLAYSPSLETGPVLLETNLPLLLLDTTPAPSFGITATPDDMLENHGIHGVQDLASFLRRNGRAYTIAAGFMQDENLLKKVNTWVQAVKARHLLQNLRVAQIGSSFEGMGDFQVSDEQLRSGVGPKTVIIDVEYLGALARSVSEDELADEREKDLVHFDCTGCDQIVLDRSNRIGLALRKALDETGAKAFSFNFISFDRKHGAPTVPFLEASKAMARGLGYAGEGDVLTASLVAALNRCYGPTTFTEMFCPDWSGGTIFMSHMGECNPALAKAKPKLVEMEYAYGPVDNPGFLVFPLQPGPAALVNIAPGPNDSMTLVATDVQIADREMGAAMPKLPHFWIAPPRGDVAGFLETYSRAGGTHHLALTLNSSTTSLRTLADIMKWNFILID
jgi:L-arabinose isomerase